MQEVAGMDDKDTTRNNTLALRDSLVKRAVQFLQNPKVLESSLAQKQDFLKRKGLTEQEIKTAFDLSSSDITVKHDAIYDHANPFTAIQMSQPVYSYYPYQMGPLQRIRDFFNTTALIGMTMYCAYWFYKTFIQSFLFSRQKKFSMEEKVSELDKTIQNSLREMKESISKVESEVHKLTQTHGIDPTIPQLVQELKQDLASLKGLLLSKRQFPPAPTSIPPWQLDATPTSQEKATEKEDDAGSGSSTNNSDSSLEVISKEVVHP